jgi:hypothetical protein
MNKTKLIPFDLERWKAGDFKRVMDSCGNKVTQLTYFKDVSDKRQLRGVRLSAIESWTIKGSWFDTPHAWDLFLEVEDKTLEGWVRVYKGRFGNSVYKSYEAARDTIDPTFVTIIKIEYPNDNN